MAELVQYYGTGRRKSSVARIFLRPGTGVIKVNGKAFEEHFVTDVQRIIARQSLILTETAQQLRRDCQLLRRRHHGTGWRGPHGHCPRAAGVQP